MARTIHDVLAELRESALDLRDQGDRFERLMKSYLQADPEWSAQFKNVYLWSEWPGRAGRPDTGIDLVAEEIDGGLAAIQCKFYLPEHTVSKGDVDSFLATSGKVGFTRRLIISTTDKWGSNAEDALHGQTVPTQRIGMGYLEESRIDWGQFQWQQPTELVIAAGKTPRPHQRAAIDAVKEKLANGGRGQLIMACGTGKTFTSLRLAEEMIGAGGRVLFLVPSIQLLSQSLREWSQETTVGIRPFAVCSDVRVGRKPAADNGDISVVDLTEPATTDPVMLQDRAGVDAADRMTVVFSTYQSIDVISQAQKLGLPEFDLIICDEAHRTTGVRLAEGDESHFVKVHDQSFLLSRRRVYMTATPKVFGDAVKQKASEADAVLTSMDNEELFGPVLHRLGFGEAVERDLLTDYKVLVLAIDETYVATTFQNAMANSGEIQLGDAAKLLGCWNGLAKNYQRDPESADTPTPAAGTEVEDVTVPITDRIPMRRAVAFAKTIRASQQAAASFPVLVDRAIETHPVLDRPRVEAAHVDGTMSILARNELLRWLKDEDAPDDVCRILSNARCLSEGVDVPALDAVMFLTPRGSQVDVVQSVGRVMRKAHGKDLGYIILPVVVPNGVPAEKALDDNERYKVVWQVLQALRSHDDRFHTMINQIDLNGRTDGHLIIDTVTPPSDAEHGDGDGAHDGGAIAVELPFDIDAYRDAMYARIVKKVGERDYLEKWTKNIAEIVEQHTVRLRGLVDNPATPEVAVQFEEFVAALRANLNDSITPDEAVNMLSQHLVTKPVFEALFDGYHFTDHNPVGQVMQTMLDALDSGQLKAETQDLEGFYDSVRQRVSGINNAAGKQTVITELYEKFFKLAFPKVTAALGIVYTPIAVVDFILRSVNYLLQIEFGTTISAPGVHVLDPFTGTGTFIVRLLTSDLIDPADLARKYTSELHANELLLLAYYIAAANIEVTYRDLRRRLPNTPAGEDAQWKPFDGIVLADTFQMTEADDTLDGRIFANNSGRAERQLGLDIRVILGNPPYSKGQTSGNDNNANFAYPTLDGRIEQTYASRSTATNKNSLYDSYIRAIRWASDRLGDSGIIGFVTNGGFIDSNTTDGLRKTLVDEFTSIYVYNLRGNQRTAGELSRREGGKVFDAGSRATVAITFLIKNPFTATAGKQAVVRYHDIGDYLTRDQKLGLVDSATVDALTWETITPNEAGDWINQRGGDFDSYPPLGDKETKDAAVFAAFSGGLKTNRDAWVYNFSRKTLQHNVESMIEFYNSQVDDFTGYVAERRITDPAEHVKTFIDTDAGQFSWNRADRTQIVRGRKYQRRPGSRRMSTYRPFTRENVWFDAELNDMVYRLPAMFPTADHPNCGFVVVAPGSDKPFAALAVGLLPDLSIWGSGPSQFFPRYTYKVVDEENYETGLDHGDDVVAGYHRIDNVTDHTLARYRAWYGSEVTKDEIFAFVYGLLHSPEYRQLFAPDLTRSLPRIPRVEAGTWPTFRDAGHALMDLHIGYETVEPYPLTITGDQPLGGAAADLYDWFAIDKIRWAGNARAADKSTIIYNPRITVAGIPAQAHQYMLGSRSAIEWIIDRYRVTTDKPSGIINNPNDYSRETGNPRYILDLLTRIVTVSVATIGIIDGLPPLQIVPST